jgi:hypothetical protein
VATIAQKVSALHTYHCCCKQMRNLYCGMLNRWLKSREEIIELHAYLGYWYAGLYVVIEGWKELKLNDPEIDKLLDSRYVDLLRKFRNGMFHFQETIEKLYPMDETQGTGKWAEDLTDAFDRYFSQTHCGTKTETRPTI